MDKKVLRNIIIVDVAVIAVFIVAIVAFIMGKNSSKDLSTADVTNDLTKELSDEPATEVMPELSAHAEDDYVLSDEPARDPTMQYPAAGDPEVMDTPGYGGTTALADSADVPEDAVLVDEYGMYRVPMEWASEYGGLFVERNGGLYTITPVIPRYVSDNYDVGQLLGGASAETAQLYFGDTEAGLPEDIPTSTRQAIASAGDFPILQVSRDEKLEYFGKSIPDKIPVIKTDFVGYTVSTIGTKCLVDRIFTDGVAEHLSVSDLNGSPVLDIRNLKYGERYLVEWYYGTEYNAVELTANCRCYTRPKRQDAIDLPVELTKSGYVSVDVSSLEPGIYAYRDAYFGDSIFEVID